MHFLLIEPDPTFVNSLTLFAERLFGHRCTAQSDFDEALYLLREYDYDVIVVGENISQVGMLRIRKITTPILVLNSSCSVPDIVDAFNAGADDYLQRPADLREVVARLEMLTRRAARMPTPTIEIGNLSISLEKRTIEAAGRRVHLTSSEWRIIEYLLVRRGHVVTKEAIINRLYLEPDEPEIKIVDVFICKIRKKLVEAGITERIIETIWGCGYKIEKAPVAAKVAA